MVDQASNVNKYRQSWESDDQWDLRKTFIVKYLNNFEEDRLLCLAQAYVNVQILGCSYPAPVMETINHLAKDLNIPRKKQKKNEVQFVRGSSDVPLAKKIKTDVEVVSMRNALDQFIKKKPNNQNSSTSSNAVAIHVDKRPSAKSFFYGDDNDDNQQEIPSPNGNKPGISDPIPCYYTASYRAQLDSTNSACNRSNQKRKSSVSGQVPIAGVQVPSPSLVSLATKVQVLKPKSGDNPLQLIQMAASSSHVSLSWDCIAVDGSLPHKPEFMCKLLVDNEFLSEGCGQNKKAAKVAACKNGLNKLEEIEVRANQDIRTRPVVNSRKRGRNVDIPTRQNKPQSAFGFIILVGDGMDTEEGAVGVLYNSCQFNRVDLKFDFDEQHRCYVMLNDEIVAADTGNTQALSKKNAAVKALRELQQTSYTIKVKQHTVAESEVSRTDIMSGPNEDDKISDSNVGNKLLRLMGWAGGGLGKYGAGIEEPITASTVVGRQGLGLQGSSAVTAKCFRDSVTQNLREYMNSDSNNDLVFSSEFSKEERKEIHSIAMKLHLKSCSRGKGDDRFLVVSRKFRCDELVQLLLESGGSTDKYELIPPGITSF